MYITCIGTQQIKKKKHECWKSSSSKIVPLHVLLQAVEGLHTELGLEFQDGTFQVQVRKNESETLNAFADHQIHYYLWNKYSKAYNIALDKRLYYMSNRKKQVIYDAKL